MSGSKKPSNSNFDVWIGDVGLQIAHHNLENIEHEAFHLGGIPNEIKDFITAMEAEGISCDVIQSSLCG